MSTRGDATRNRRARLLRPETKMRIYQGLVSGHMTQQEAADHYGVDRSTIARIRRVGDDALLEALERSRPGRPRQPNREELEQARSRIDHLERLVTDQRRELDALRGRAQWG